MLGLCAAALLAGCSEPEAVWGEENANSASKALDFRTQEVFEADLTTISRKSQPNSARNAYFGDLHVHTTYSFDAYAFGTVATPADAYRYAKGQAITLPDANGEQLIEARIQRPLDFTSVTDHAEYLGPINMCTKDSSKLGYWWPHCMMTRASHFWTQMLAASWWTNPRAPAA